jgi:hypothetical protein
MNAPPTNWSVRCRCGKGEWWEEKGVVGVGAAVCQVRKDFLWLRLTELGWEGKSIVLELSLKVVQGIINAPP